MSALNSLGNANCVIDKDKRIMYTYSRNNNIVDPNYGSCKISCFDIPDIKMDTVYLNGGDIKESYFLNCSAIYMQGGCIEGGFLYIGQGYKDAGFIYLNVIDLEKKKLDMRIDLLGKNIRWEPEGCFYYNGKVMLSAGTNIWEFDLG